MSVELEACPFCGHGAKVFQSSGVWWVECTRCHAATRGEQSEANAAAHWNKRVPTEGGRKARPAQRPDLSKPSEAAARVRRMYPVIMPAGKAMHVLGVSRNTFFALVKQGLVESVKVTESGRKSYRTESVLKLAGLE